jgi:hypothetical protein
MQDCGRQFGEGAVDFEVPGVDDNLTGERRAAPERLPFTAARETDPALAPAGQRTPIRAIRTLARRLALVVDSGQLLTGGLARARRMIASGFPRPA